VQAVAMRPALFAMAITAFNGLKIFGMAAPLAVCEISVAFHACHAGMHGTRDHFRRNIGGNLRVATVARHFRVVVAAKTLGVFQGKRWARCKPEDCGCCEQPLKCAARPHD